MERKRNLPPNIIIIPLRGGLAAGGATIMVEILKGVNIFTHLSNACYANPECLHTAVLLTDIIGIIIGGMLGLAVSKKIIK